MISLLFYSYLFDIKKNKLFKIQVVVHVVVSASALASVLCVTSEVLARLSSFYHEAMEKYKLKITISFLFGIFFRPAYNETIFIHLVK